MKYPHGRCGDCGERVYEHVEGGYQCFNCEARYLKVEQNGGSDGGATDELLKA